MMKFIKLKFPGYFYEEESERLFSLKVSGDLKPLYKNTYGHNQSSWHMIKSSGTYYQISFKGKRKTIFLKDIKEGKFNFSGKYDIMVAVNVKL